MKLFCDFFTRRRTNKKKETVNLLSSPINTLSNNAIQSTHQSISSSNLFNKQSRCTCDYFNFNGNSMRKSLHTKPILTNRSSLNIISSPSEYSSNDVKYILTVADFCFWYDVRSTLLDIIDRVVLMNEIPSIVKSCPPETTNRIHRKNRRPKTSIAIQTSYDYEQKRNAKIQTNTVILFPLQKQNVSSSKLFLN